MQGCVARVTKDIGAHRHSGKDAGITKDTTFKKMSKADWDAVIRTNLGSVFSMNKQSWTA
jgi:acetoacetyl-CoA reductase